MPLGPCVQPSGPTPAAQDGATAMVDEAREHRLEVQRRWKAANPERVQRYRENARRQAQQDPEHREKILKQKRDAEHRRQARLKVTEARREHDRERVRQWAAAHPERVRARQQDWVQRNHERVREQKRAYYHRNLEQRQYVNRERNAKRRKDPAQLDRERAYRTANQGVHEAATNAHRSDPAVRERHNQDQRDRRQREKRRRELGLPPLPLHRSTLNERADATAAADMFFTRPRTKSDIKMLRAELDQLHKTITRDVVIDIRHQAELAARIRTALERPARINAAIDTYLKSPVGARLHEEVRMDSIARQIRGANPYPSLEAEVRRRAIAKISTERRTSVSAAASRTSRSILPVAAPSKPARATPGSAAHTLWRGKTLLTP